MYTLVPFSVCGDGIGSSLDAGELEDLLVELGGLRAVLDLRGIDVVSTENRGWVGLEDNSHIERPLGEPFIARAARHVARHRGSRCDDELGKRGPVCN